MSGPRLVSIAFAWLTVPLRGRPDLFISQRCHFFGSSVIATCISTCISRCCEQANSSANCKEGREVPCQRLKCLRHLMGECLCVQIPSNILVSRNLDNLTARIDIRSMLVLMTVYNFQVAESPATFGSCPSLLRHLQSSSRC